MIELFVMLLAPVGMRATDMTFASQQPIADLSACSLRALNSIGRATPIPADNGISVDFVMKNLIAADGKNLVTFEFIESGDHRKINVFYRHPWSAKTTEAFTRSLAKRCFRAEYETWKAETAE